MESSTPWRDTAWAMSEENVEIIRGIVQAFIEGVERRDFSVAWGTEAVSEELEWIPAAEMAEQRSFRGRDDFVDFMRGWTEDFEEYSVDLERLIDAGNHRVVGLFHQTATGRGSGVPVRQDYAMVYELTDGQLVRMQIYLDRDAALEAAGLSE